MVHNPVKESYRHAKDIDGEVGEAEQYPGLEEARILSLDSEHEEDVAGDGGQAEGVHEREDDVEVVLAPPEDAAVVIFRRLDVLGATQVTNVNSLDSNTILLASVTLGVKSIAIHLFGPFSGLFRALF